MLTFWASVFRADHFDASKFQRQPLNRVVLLQTRQMSAIGFETKVWRITTYENGKTYFYSFCCLCGRCHPHKLKLYTRRTELSRCSQPYCIDNNNVPCGDGVRFLFPSPHRSDPCMVKSMHANSGFSRQRRTVHASSAALERYA